MENNIEKKVKEHFRNREITPNPLLWEVLNAKLEQKQNTKKSTFYRYFAITGMLIGFLIALTIFFRQHSNIKQKENLITVDKKQPKTLIPKTKKKLALPIKQKPIIGKNKKYVASKNTVKPEKYSVKKTVKLTENFPENDTHDVSKNNSDKEKIIVANNPQKTPLSDAEMNKLLVASLRNLIQEDTTNLKIKIKTGEILYTLENEEDNTLKNKIIKKLIAGAQAVENHISNN